MGEITAYWRKQSPEAWDHFCKYNIRNENNVSIYPESVKFMIGFSERHIPISNDILSEWQKEVSDTSYGQVLKKDIAWAKKCNLMNDEVLIWEK